MNIKELVKIVDNYQEKLYNVDKIGYIHYERGYAKVGTRSSLSNTYLSEKLIANSQQAKDFFEEQIK